MAFAIAAAVLILGLLVRRYASLEWIIDHENRLRSLVAADPLTSWLIVFVLYIGLSLIPGTSGKSVVCGWFFGFWPAVLMVDVALTVAAVVVFLASRSILRPVIESRYPTFITTLKNRLQGQTAYYMLMIRFLHAPFSFVNYTAGASSIVSVRTFCWTTLLGVLPGTMIFVFVGTRLPTLAELAQHGPLPLLDAPLVVSLVATVCLPIVIKGIGDRITRRNQRHGRITDVKHSEGT
jgi:uncharacterized membrane protein YdjX (TVP38/TMEM64 family)